MQNVEAMRKMRNAHQAGGLSATAATSGWETPMFGQLTSIGAGISGLGSPIGSPKH